MAEVLGAAGSIAGIVSFGLQLATTLQTYIETMLEAEERLRDITFEINSTASALRQLQDILDDDKRGTGVGKLSPKVFKNEGRREIEAIAQKCGKVYRTIVLLVNKAANLGPKNMVSTASSDVVQLKISSLTRMMKWPWVEPHIKRCQEQLRWLKMSLLFNLQLASLARLQLGTHDKTTGEDEVVIRKMIVFLRRNEITAAKALTRTQEKRQAVASSSSSSSPLSALAHNLSQSPHEEIKPPEKPMSNFSVRARSFSPGAEEMSDIGIMSEKEINPINTDNIFVLNMTQQTATLHSSGNVSTLNGFHQPEKNMRNLRRVTTRISEEPEEPPEAYRCIADEMPSEPIEELKQESEALRDISNNITDGSKNPLKNSINQQEISPQVTVKASSTIENGLALATSIQQRRFTNSGMSRIKRLPSWLKEVFSPHGDSYDWESETLEAFVLLEKSWDIIKVPFGDRGLRRLKKKLDVSWDQYASLNSDQHQLVDKAILEAKLLDPRERICIGVGLYPRAEDDAIFVFLSLGDHLEPVHFTDFLGRQFKFPFQFFRLWDKSNPEFIRLFQHMNEVGSYVSDGCYDILDEGGNIVMPQTIKHLIEPGARLSMQIWAKPEIDHSLLIAEKEAIQNSKAIALQLAMGEVETKAGKETLKLKDALGRMYTFPFGICKTWDGISGLINQAFLNINIYGLHVANGHYDLVGPNNCKILPQLWEETVQPGWSVSMCLWPKPEYPSDILVPWHIFPRSKKMIDAPLNTPYSKNPSTEHVGGDYTGAGYGSGLEWGAVPRHHHPTRLSDVLREDEQSRTTRTDSYSGDYAPGPNLVTGIDKDCRDMSGPSSPGSKRLEKEQKIEHQVSTERGISSYLTVTSLGANANQGLEVGMVQCGTEPVYAPHQMPRGRPPGRGRASTPLPTQSQQPQHHRANSPEFILRPVLSPSHSVSSLRRIQHGYLPETLQGSAHSFTTTSSQPIPDEDCNSGYRFDSDSRPAIADEDIDLDLDIDLTTEELSISELLGRYTNASNTAIREDDHKVEFSEDSSSSSWRTYDACK